MTEDLRSDGVPPAVLCVALAVPGLHHGHRLQVADGRLHAGPAQTRESLAGLNEIIRWNFFSDSNPTFTFPTSLIRLQNGDSNDLFPTLRNSM